MEHKSTLDETKHIMTALHENHGLMQDCDCLVLSRVLGHPEIANSMNWRVSDSCWICQKWKYTLVFFDETTCEHRLVQDQRMASKYKKAIL